GDRAICRSCGNRLGPPLPKFITPLEASSARASEAKGALSKLMILVPLFDLTFLNVLAADGCRNFKSAALARGPSAAPILVMVNDDATATGARREHQSGCLLRPHDGGKP